MSNPMTLDQFENAIEEIGYITERNDRIALTTFLATELERLLFESSKRTQ